jgi:hypothetical protein
MWYPPPTPPGGQMISRIYTVHREPNEMVTYKGFDCKFKPSEMDLVALVQNEDSIDTYVLDDTQLARNEFVRFIADEGDENLKIIGIYKRAK